MGFICIAARTGIIMCKLFRWYAVLSFILSSSRAVLCCDERVLRVGTICLPAPKGRHALKLYFPSGDAFSGCGALGKPKTGKGMMYSPLRSGIFYLQRVMTGDLLSYFGGIHAATCGDTWVGFSRSFRGVLCLDSGSRSGYVHLFISVFRGEFLEINRRGEGMTEGQPS